MKYFLITLLMSFNVYGAQINLDCFDSDNNKVASVYTPTFVYSSLNLKANITIDGEEVKIDLPFNSSSELQGVYFSKAEDGLSVIGVSKLSPFSVDGKIHLSVLKNGFLIENLVCETTVNNPSFPR